MIFLFWLSDVDDMILLRVWNFQMIVLLVVLSVYMKWFLELINIIGGIVEVLLRFLLFNKKRKIKNKLCEINYEYEMIIFSGNGGL